MAEAMDELLQINNISFANNRRFLFFQITAAQTDP
jgi:hypothetical protein